MWVWVIRSAREVMWLSVGGEISGGRIGSFVWHIQRTVQAAFI